MSLPYPLCYVTRTVDRDVTSVSCKITHRYYHHHVVNRYRRSSGDQDADDPVRTLRATRIPTENNPATEISTFREVFRGERRAGHLVMEEAMEEEVVVTEHYAIPPSEL